ncbi:transmembrane protein [Citrus sinensis]|nr:transmembrane protein [Citrus sinensis]
MLAIGPYHRGKDHLMAFEEHKTRYLQNLLHRRGLNRSLSDYVMTMRALEEKARKCYAGYISLDKEEFLEMMLLDGCFIVEVIRKNLRKELREDNDPIFKLGWMLPCIARDMFLVENQLPFFVLWELFSMTEVTKNNQANYSFFYMILYFFYGILPGKGYPRVDVYPIEEIKHLVGFIHNNWLPSPTGIDAFKINASKNSEWKFICCATEIQEAGVKFQKVEDGLLFDIKFDNGVMKIPTLAIGDTTEAVLRNLIAYEQFSHDQNSKHILDYVKFLDCLINSSKDAELLRRCGIIDNWLGDDEVIAGLISRLGDAVVLSDQFYYSEVFNKVNLHCSRRVNKWKAKLRHNYFNTPWAIISFLAAAVLLLLTLLQALLLKCSRANPTRLPITSNSKKEGAVETLSKKFHHDASPSRTLTTNRQCLGSPGKRRMTRTHSKSITTSLAQQCTSHNSNSMTYESLHSTKKVLTRASIFGW